MRKMLVAITCLIATCAIQAQTCVGTFKFQLLDPKTKKPLKENLERNIVYGFTADEKEFYDNSDAVVPIDTVMKHKEKYSARVNEKGYNFFPDKDPSVAYFPTLCGLYLVHMDFFGKQDTMSLSIYNIPAHQSFQIDSLLFQKGKFFIDLQASSRLSEFKFLDDKGYFVIPHAAIEPVAVKEGEEK